MTYHIYLYLIVKYLGGILAPKEKKSDKNFDVLNYCFFFAAFYGVLYVRLIVYLVRHH